MMLLLLTATWAQATLTLSQKFDSGASVGSIPDGNPVGMAFGGNFTYAGANDQVLGVSVTLDITGGYNGNLYAYLVAPNGTVVVLLNKPGTPSGNPFGAPGSGMTAVTLADGNPGDVITLNSYANTTATINGNPLNPTDPNGAIQTATESPGVALTGAYNAAGTLANFDGSSANGEWTLFFADLTSGGGTSILNDWSLNLTVVPEPVLMALLTFVAMLLALAGLKWAWKKT